MHQAEENEAKVQNVRESLSADDQKPLTEIKAFTSEEVLSGYSIKEDNDDLDFLQDRLGLANLRKAREFVMEPSAAI